LSRQILDVACDAIPTLDGGYARFMRKSTH
jgi:hypothetical protein